MAKKFLTPAVYKKTHLWNLASKKPI